MPKLEFFYSIGFSQSDLAKTLALDPTLLSRSLDNQIIPSYNFLKTVVLSDDKIVSALKRTTWIFLKDYKTTLVPNISFLTEMGVPQKSVTLLLAHFPETMMQKHEEFCRTVMEVAEMGFHPKKTVFVLAVHAISGKGNKSIWERCFEVYRKWGWPKDDILEAFRRHPHCIMLSEEKINKNMEFLVKKMGWPSKMIVRLPVVLFFSLEKRIVPRCSVVQVLLSKGLVKEDLSLATVLLLPVEKLFLERFVARYKKEVPGLLDVYQGKIAASEI